MKHILKCAKCGSYGLNEMCDCGNTRIEPRPPKFSPQDKYGAYRREAKKLETDSENN
jgi:H/ACA ribonucleoprotein complex subunit 3